MRAHAIVASLVAAGVAVSIARSGAAPERDTTSWADWAGSYRGALRWSGCSLPGAKSAAVALAFVDGVASIDLAAVRPAMSSLTLVSDDHGWSARQGDLAVAITRPKHDTIDLALDLDTGCTMRGRLTRASSNIAACDALVGWARIEASCSKLSSPPLEDVAKLTATKWKPAEASRCTARAATIERELIDAGCAPHPDPLIGVRARDCVELSQLAGTLSRCGNLPQEIKNQVITAAQALASAAQSAEKATLPYVDKQCRDVRTSLVAIATQFRCPQ